MKKGFLAAVLSFAAIAAFAQVTDSLISVRSFWVKGEKKQIAWHDITEETKGKSMKKVTTDVVARLEVLNIAKDTSTLLYQYVSVVTDEPDTLVRKLSERMRGMKLKFSTDKDGAFRYLLNIGDVQKFLNKSFDTIGMAYKKQPAVGTFLAELRKVMTTRQFIEQKFMEDIQSYLSLYGADIPAKGTLAGEGELPNLLGGQALGTQFKMGISSLDLYRELADVWFSQTVNKESLAQLIADYKAVMKKGGVPVPAGTNPSASVKDIASWTYNGHTGWIDACSMERDSKVGNIRNYHKLTGKVTDAN